MRIPIHETLRWIIVFSLLLLVGWTGRAWAESIYRLNKDGLKDYENKKYGEAAQSFDKASRKAPENLRLVYNLETARAASGKTNEALDGFAKVGEARDADLAARARFAQGVIHYLRAEGKKKAGDAAAAGTEVDAAIGASRDALRADPSDPDARVNLELALNLKKEIEKTSPKDQNDPNKQQKQQKQNQQDQQKQQQNQDQQRKEEQKQNPDQKKDQQQDQQKNPDQQQKKPDSDDQNKDRQQPESPKPQKPENQQKPEESPAEKQMEKNKQDQDPAMSILNLIEDNDQEALKRMLRNRYGVLTQPEKDW